jgi:hypothetical protein
MFKEPSRLIAFKFNCHGALARAFEKPPAVERGVMPTTEFDPHPCHRLSRMPSPERP